MPRDTIEGPSRFYPSTVAGEAGPTSLDMQGWCRAVASDPPPAPEPRGYGQVTRPPGFLPERGDLLGWSVVLLTAPALFAGAAAMLWYCADRLF